RPGIEERQRVRPVQHHVGGSGAVADGAEHAGRAGHARCCRMTNVNLSSGLPETVLPDPPADAAAALSAAASTSASASASDRAAVADVCARWPRFLAAWATLGELVEESDVVQSYAYFRVG